MSTIIRWRRRGLSVAEVVIAIAILALMLVTVLVLFTQLMTATSKNSNLSAGALFADRILEQAARTVHPNTPAFDPVVSGEQTILTHDEDHPTVFSYTLEATQLTAATLPGESWMLEVEVRWWQSDPSNPQLSRAGSGHLFTRQSRMVYVSR